MELFGPDAGGAVAARVTTTERGRSTWAPVIWRRGGLARWASILVLHLSALLLVRFAVRQLPEFLPELLQRIIRFEPVMPRPFATREDPLPRTA